MRYPSCCDSISCTRGRMTVTVPREHVLFFGCRRSRRGWRQSKPSDAYHSQPHRQRTESHSLSFFRIALQTAHDLNHIALLPAPALSRVRNRGCSISRNGMRPACSAAATAVAGQAAIDPYTVFESPIILLVTRQVSFDCQRVVRLCLQTGGRGMRPEGGTHAP